MYVSNESHNLKEVEEGKIGHKPVSNPGHLHSIAEFQPPKLPNSVIANTYWLAAIHTTTLAFSGIVGCGKRLDVYISEE